MILCLSEQRSMMEKAIIADENHWRDVRERAAIDAAFEMVC